MVGLAAFAAGLLVAGLFFPLGCTKGEGEKATCVSVTGLELPAEMSGLPSAFGGPATFFLVLLAPKVFSRITRRLEKVVAK